MPGWPKATLCGGWAKGSPMTTGRPVSEAVGEALASAAAKARYAFLDRPPLRPVLGEMFRLLRRYGLRAFLLAILAQVLIVLVGGFASGPYFLLMWLAERKGLAWLYDTYTAVIVLAVFVAGPIEAAYQVALNRMLDGERPGPRALFAAYARWRLFLNVGLACAVVYACDLLLPRLGELIPWNFLGELVREDSPLSRAVSAIPARRWMLRELERGFFIVLLIPLAWAAYDALLSGRSWRQALGRSVRLACRNPWLALLAAAFAFVLPFDRNLANLVPVDGEGIGHFVWELLRAAQLMTHAILTWANLMLQSTALVVIYRAMLRRDTPPVPARAA